MLDIKDKDITLTPIELIDSLGKFDLDPCGIIGHLTAKKIFQLPIDGLKENWFGRIWLNPPYSNTFPWLEKLSYHNNGIALVLASTGTKWFQNYIFQKADSILFLNKRPKFTRLDYSRCHIMRDCVLVAYGKNNTEYLKLSNIGGSLIYL